MSQKTGHFVNPYRCLREYAWLSGLIVSVTLVYERLLTRMNFKLPWHGNVRNMEEKRDYDRFYQADRTEKKRANLKFAKMKKDEKKKKQMADRQSGSITSLDLA
jgi:hypothetical protein